MRHFLYLAYVAILTVSESLCASAQESDRYDEENLLRRAKETLKIDTVGGGNVQWAPYRGVEPSATGIFRGVWNWDSAFHAMALVKWDAELAREQFRIMMKYQGEDGMLPDVVFEDSAKGVFRGCTKPPVWGWAVWTIDRAAPDDVFLREAYEALKRYEAFWRTKRFVADEGMFHYDGNSGDPAQRKLYCGWESGWDDSPRWDGNPGNVLPIDLNCWMVLYYRSLRDVAARLRLADESSLWSRKGEELASRIESRLWDSADGCYYDWDMAKGDFSRVLTPASFMPLFIGIAPSIRAAAMARQAKRMEPGWPTVSYDNPEYRPDVYWRGRTWLNVAYFALKGLKFYGYEEIADAGRAMILGWVDACKPSIYENYNSRTGEPLGERDFGWSAVFTVKFIEDWQMPRESELPSSRQAAKPLLGVDQVRWDGMACERMGWRRPYEEHNAANYASRKEWEDETVARLLSWGFNMLGACCDDALRHKGLKHAIFLNMGESFCSCDEDKWISECKGVPNTALPNVFHPDFEKHCDAVAREMCARNCGDADLVGYFIDNELVWQGRHGAPLDTGLFDVVRERRDGCSAKQALMAFLRVEGVADFAVFDALPPERRTRLKIAFLQHFAERYFRATAGAIRRHDPAHLVLGCRFAGLDGAAEIVWKEAGRFCDVITFNCYPWADIDRNVVLDVKGGTPVVTRLAKVHELTGKPLFVTEWSFPALDAARPCINGAGQRFRTQTERVQASELFARTMLSLPYVIGYSYFMWVDQPALGTNGVNPEDCNYGLVSECGVPYEELTDMFRRVHEGSEHRPSCPVPREKTAETHALSTSDAFRAGANGNSEDVKFSREGDEWMLSNSSGLVLRGCVGGQDMIREVKVGELLYGRYNGMVQIFTQEGDSRWLVSDRVKSVVFGHEGACGVLRIIASGREGDCSFDLVHRITVAPGNADFLCEVEKLENTGKTTFSVRRFYTCPYAAESRPSVRKGVPNLWKGPCECHWVMDDGRTYGMKSYDEAAEWFNLWTDTDGCQHPDIGFFSPSVAIGPGEFVVPSSPMGAISCLSSLSGVSL